MSARGCLVGLLGVVVALSALETGADVAARHYTTTKVEQRISKSLPAAKGVHAWIHGWPFLQVGVNGHVDDIGATIASLQAGDLVFTAIRVELHGVRISTSDLLSDHKVVVTGISQGTVSVAITDPSLVVAVLRAVGIVSPSAAKQALAVAPTINPLTRKLEIHIPGFPTISLSLPDPALMPCLPDVKLSGETLQLSCSFDKVPAAFTDAATTSPSP